MGIAVKTRAAPGDRLDWNDIKDRLDLATVVAALLGPPVRRIGARLAWLCPLHDDHDPSFTVDDRGWRCWSCATGGDAVGLVRRLEPGLGFPEAIRRAAELGGIALPGRPTRSGLTARPPVRPPVRPAERPPGESSGLDRQEAERLVADASERIWRPEGAAALAYLRGRGLTEATIRAARLGWADKIRLPKRDGDGTWTLAGITIPWGEPGRLTRIKVRRLGLFRGAKYIEVFADGWHVYPSMASVRPGMPLVVCEGEFDALLLIQELADLASVVTLGSTSSRPGAAFLVAAMACPTWFVALDADPSGDDSAAKWPARAVRVRPPAGDWTEAIQAGTDLRRWWTEEYFPAEFDKLERASIYEFDGGLTREAAELAAGLLPRQGEMTVDN